MTITPEKLRRVLLAWYDANHRDLPWRQSTDPYRVWVSEIMLQQTRVDAVIPYYNRWLATFPNVDALASAELHDVLMHWEGLGYYSRARNLHSAARLVRERLGGRIPETYETLRQLPGVGEYTAGAIASISHNEKQPAVDGNVRRVVSRIFDVSAPTAAAMRARAAEIVDPERPGDFNQALMELGATVCTPRKPECCQCPVRMDCLAYARGTVNERPGAKAKKQIPHEYVVSTAVFRNGSLLLAQRPTPGLLGGMWEFPEGEERADSVVIGSVTHTFSHKRVSYRLVTGRERRVRTNERWIALEDLHLVPLPTAQRKLEKLVRAYLESSDDSQPADPRSS